MELGGELAEVGVHAVRAAPFDGLEDDEREPREGAHQVAFVGADLDVAERRPRRRCCRLAALVRGQIAQHAADPGVGVLHVVDGVLARLLHREIEVEVECRVVTAGDHEEAHGVDPDGGGKVVDRDDIAAALRHTPRHAAFKQVHELADDQLEAVGVVRRQGGEHGFHARHVAVVVGAPDVDQVAKPTVHLVAVVGDVGEEVRGRPARSYQHPVLVVAVVGGAQPHGAVGVEELAVAVELAQGLADLAGEAAMGRAAFVQRGLARPHVERHAQTFEGRAEPAEDGVAAPCLDLVDHRRRHPRHVGRRGGHGLAVALADLVDQAVGDLEQVVALVAVVGQRHLDPQALRVARRQRLTELHHLGAEVVDVELARHFVTGEGEQTAERVAHRRVAGVANVQRTRRVDADELDIDLLPAVGRQHVAAVVVAERQHVPGRAAVPAIVQEQVEKPRTGDLVAGADAGAGRRAPARAELVGQLARVAARPARDRQGDGRRDIAELGLGRQRQLGRRPFTGNDRGERSLERPSEAGQPVQLLVLVAIAHLEPSPLPCAAAAPPGASSPLIVRPSDGTSRRGRSSARGRAVRPAPPGRAGAAA